MAQEMSDMLQENTYKKRHADPSKIQEYFDRYADSVCNYAYSYLNNREEAKDVVQDVFLRLLENEALLFSNDIAVKTYLFTSVRNSCINLLKRRNPVLYTADLINFQIIDEEFATVDEQMIKRLQKEIFGLPPQTQKVIIGIFYRNQKYKEIAAELDVSVNTIKTLLKEGIKKLRNSFGTDLEMILFLWHRKSSCLESLAPAHR